MILQDDPDESEVSELLFSEISKLLRNLWVTLLQIQSIENKQEAKILLTLRGPATNKGVSFVSRTLLHLNLSLDLGQRCLFAVCMS